MDLPLVGDSLSAYWLNLAHNDAAFAIAVEPYVSQARDWMLKSGANLGQGAIELTLSVLICFFVYRDGSEAAEKLRSGIRRLGGDRKSVVYGKSVSVRVDLGGRRIIKQKK